ncbi:hypothetical protein LEMLEM_LOCUS19000, partial [Lemmus lemmus]
RWVSSQLSFATHKASATATSSTALKTVAARALLGSQGPARSCTEIPPAEDAPALAPDRSSAPAACRACTVQRDALRVTRSFSAPLSPSRGLPEKPRVQIPSLVH